MKRTTIIVVNRRFLYPAAIIVLLVTLVFFTLLNNRSARTFRDSRTIAVDAGHGGIDGGANRDGLLEKDINLSISRKLAAMLEKKGFKAVVTRSGDVSLDSLDRSGGSRHQRDLSARLNIINGSNACLFVSIHVNSNYNEEASGSVVVYNDKFAQNTELAYSIQRELNSLPSGGKKRAVHDPVKGKFFLLGHSNIPGVIVETAFISNAAERELLKTEEFRELLAKAIYNGIMKHLGETIEDIAGG